MSDTMVREIQLMNESLDAGYKLGFAACREAAAKIADNERMTGIPPVGQWSEREIEIAEKTVIVTGRSIAAAIRALKEPKP
jgi:hypothetical protein